MWTGKFMPQCTPSFSPPTPMSVSLKQQFIAYLQTELAIPAESIAVVLRREQHADQLHMLLWQYGLISLQQLETIFDWLETASLRTAVA